MNDQAAKDEKKEKDRKFWEKQAALLAQDLPSARAHVGSWKKKNPGWFCELTVNEYPPCVYVEAARFPKDGREASDYHAFAPTGPASEIKAKLTDADLEVFGELTTKLVQVFGWKFKRVNVKPGVVSYKFWKPYK